LIAMKWRSMRCGALYCVIEQGYTLVFLGIACYTPKRQ
jgi:hypothetical protein